MAGLAPELPLRRDDVDGYKLIRSFSDLARQNLKMVVLTSPGERIMDPNFGVGLKHYFFENNIPSTYEDIKSRIVSQVSAYLPYIRILDVKFRKAAEVFQTDNLLIVKIEYLVIPIQAKSNLEVTLDFITDDF